MSHISSTGRTSPSLMMMRVCRARGKQRGARGTERDEGGPKLNLGLSWSLFRFCAAAAACLVWRNKENSHVFILAEIAAAAERLSLSLTRSLSMMLLLLLLKSVRPLGCLHACIHIWAYTRIILMHLGKPKHTRMQICLPPLFQPTRDGSSDESRRRRPASTCVYVAFGGSSQFYMLPGASCLSMG